MMGTMRVLLGYMYDTVSSVEDCGSSDSAADRAKGTMGIRLPMGIC